MNENIKPELRGGLGSIWGTQYHQQNRIYDSTKIAMCLPANIPGGSYMYLVKENFNGKNVQTGF